MKNDAPPATMMRKIIIVLLSPIWMLLVLLFCFAVRILPIKFDEPPVPWSDDHGR